MNYLTNYYKNLSEQLQDRVNHLEKLLKEGFNDPKMPHDAASREYATDSNQEFADIAAGENAMDTHNKIAALIARHHSDVAPHISRNLGSHNYDQKLSEKDILKSLTTSKYYTSKPFTSVDDAIERMGSEFMPPVIYPEKGNKHWGGRDVVDMSSRNGEIHPHAEELVWDRVLGSIYQEEEEANKKK
jgi:hypothetical protein